MLAILVKYIEGCRHNLASLSVPHLTISTGIPQLRIGDYLRHHSAPSNDVGFASLSGLLFELNQCLQQALKVIVCRVIELSERLITG